MITFIRFTHKLNRKEPLNHGHRDSEAHFKYEETLHCCLCCEPRSDT